ncbi:hypothetical protein K445DRAFT_317224 [Daldinia sp. EC12]|nr:hypothetical protein K445DRAFT_317224 [Daldinia sp. EC12]
MKRFGILLRVIAIFSTSQALSIRTPAEDATGVQNSTSPMYAMSLDEETRFQPGGFASGNASVNASRWEIPVSHMSCTVWHNIQDADFVNSTQKMIAWSDKGNRIDGRSLHIESRNSAAVYLCNCKKHFQDSAPANEMWEFYKLIIIYCGKNRSGWIFSKKWEKGYALAYREYVINNGVQMYLCPPGCVRHNPN